MWQVQKMGQPTSWPRMDAQLQGKQTSKAGLAQEEKGAKTKLQQTLGLAMRSALPEEFDVTPILF